MHKCNRFVYQVIIIVLLIVLDQATKYWALHNLSYASPVPMNAFLNWTLLFNTGAAFSFMSSAGHWHTWFFMAFSVIASVCIIVYLYRLKDRMSPTRIGFLCILSGAWGNLIDRFHYGYVVDFIELHWGIYSWPVFNIADSAICIGAALIILDSFKHNEN